MFETTGDQSGTRTDNTRQFLGLRLAIPTLATVAAIAAGCGDNLDEPSAVDAQVEIDAQPEDCPEHIVPEGALAGPEQLPSDGCDAATLDGLDMVGLWYQLSAADADPSMFRQNRPVKFIRRCNTLTVPDTGRVTFVSEGPEGPFWRTAIETPTRNFVFAGKVCRDNGDGTLFGHVGLCIEMAEEDDVCFPAGPHTFSVFDRIPGESEAQGLTLLSEWRAAPPDYAVQAFAINVRVVDDIAYLAMGSDGLRIVDISDPVNPVPLGHFEYPDFFNDVKVVDGPTGSRYVILAGSDAVLVIDVSDPALPDIAAQLPFDPSGGAHTVFTETIGTSHYAYLANGFSPTLAVFDVTDPAAPVWLGNYVIPDATQGIHDLYAEGGRVYLNATFDGMFVADVLPNPANGTLVGHYLPMTPAYSHSNWVTQAGGRTISVHGDEGYDAHIGIIDVDPTSPEFMQQIGTFKTRALVSVHNIMAFGDRAYFTYYQDGVRVLDLSDPTQPGQIAYFNTWNPENSVADFFEGAIGLDVDLTRNRIYVADIDRGLMILQID